MTLEAQRRLELFVAVIGCPPAAGVAWGVGMKLAGAALMALWFVLVTIYLVDHARHRDTASAAPVPTQHPQQLAPAVDPAAELLRALGSDLTGEKR